MAWYQKNNQLINDNLLIEQNIFDNDELRTYMNASQESEPIYIHAYQSENCIWFALCLQHNIFDNAVVAIDVTNILKTFKSVTTTRKHLINKINDFMSQSDMA